MAPSGLPRVRSGTARIDLTGIASSTWRYSSIRENASDSALRAPTLTPSATAHTAGTNTTSDAMSCRAARPPLSCATRIERTPTSIRTDMMPTLSAILQARWEHRCPHCSTFCSRGALSPGWGRASGSVKKNVLPTPTALSTQMRPPWTSTIPLAIDSPRPVPPRADR